LKCWIMRLKIPCSLLQTCWLLILLQHLNRNSLNISSTSDFELNVPPPAPDANANLDPCFWIRYKHWLQPCLHHNKISFYKAFPPLDINHATFHLRCFHPSPGAAKFCWCVNVIVADSHFGMRFRTINILDTTKDVQRNLFIERIINSESWVDKKPDLCWNSSKNT
jgi:hypothetical protein